MAGYERNAILNDLKSSILEVTFTKADGTRRIMHCTLMPEHLPTNTDLDHLDKQHEVKKNQDVCVCWDMREHGWRSFKASTVLYVQEASTQS